MYNYFVVVVVNGYEVRILVLPLAVNVLPAVRSIICVVRACKTARRYFSCFNKSFNSVNLSVEIDSEYLAYVLFLNSLLIVPDDLYRLCKAHFGVCGLCELK